MRFLLGVIAAIVILILGALLVIWSGIYNIAAGETHFQAVRWALDAAMENSVKRHADDIKAPEHFSADQVRSGFKSFDEMCVHCHGAPGVKRSEWAEGLRPQPPELSEEIHRWNSAQVFWIIKHGIKMTAMPAFGPTHDEAVLWDVVAFVKQLPSLAPEDYARLRREIGSSGAGASHGHGGGD